jgi:hypothetical protein
MGTKTKPQLRCWIVKGSDSKFDITYTAVTMNLDPNFCVARDLVIEFRMKKPKLQKNRKRCQILLSYRSS